MADLTDDELDNLDASASWMMSVRDAALTEEDQRRVGERVLRAVEEIRHHRAAMQRIGAWRDWLCRSPGSINDKIGQHVTALIKEES